VSSFFNGMDETLKNVISGITRLSATGPAWQRS
jgi:hypothetical protein